MADKDKSMFRCEPCNSVFPDDETYERHIKSSAHQAQAISNKMLASRDDTESESSEDGGIGDEITCNICHKSFSGVIPYKHHLKSAQHFKQLEKELLTDKLMKDPRKQKDIRNKDSHDNDTTIIPEAFASCSICKKKFSGPQAYQQHIRSRKHARKVEEENFMENLREKNDDMENIVKLLPKDTSASVSQKLLDDLKEKFTIKPSADPDDSPSEEIEDIYYCKDCNKTFSGFIPYAQHMISLVHDKKLKQNQLLQSLTTEALADAMNSDTRHQPHSPSTTDACASRRVRFIEDVMCCDICHMSFSGPESAKAHLKSRGHQKKCEFLKFKAELKNKNSVKSSKSKKRDESATAETSDVTEPSTSSDTNKLEVQKSTTLGIDDNGAYESSGREVTSDSSADEDLEENSIPTVVPRKKRQSSTKKVTNTIKDILEEEF